MFIVIRDVLLHTQHLSHLVQKQIPPELWQPTMVVMNTCIVHHQHEDVDCQTCHY